MNPSIEQAVRDISQEDIDRVISVLDKIFA